MVVTKSFGFDCFWSSTRVSEIYFYTLLPYLFWFLLLELER